MGDPTKKEEGNSLEETKNINIPGEVYFQNYRIHSVWKEEKKNREGRILWNWDGVSSLKVRSFQENDQDSIIWNENSEGEEIFINEKIPKEQRKRVPILLYQEEIIALGNFKRANMERKKQRKNMHKNKESDIERQTRKR